MLQFQALSVSICQYHSKRWPRRSLPCVPNGEKLVTEGQWPFAYVCMSTDEYNKVHPKLLSFSVSLSRDMRFTNILLMYLLHMLTIENYY